MKWLAILWTVGLLAACSLQDGSGGGLAGTPADAYGDSRLANGTVCRVGPDGGPVVADRGIGGTGSPRVADRGIGGTGIVGVITGFASICVNGMEVRYDSSARVDINGVPASPAALRAGQVVVILAQGPQTAPVASFISVRQEVIGRIEAVELGSGLLTIAGQPIAVVAQTRGASGRRLGDWVSVSGLRGSNGTLVASRLDAAPPGKFIVHGQVSRGDGATRIGGLILPGTAASFLRNGQFVTVSGHYLSGQAVAITAAADSLASSPGDYFGPDVKHLVLESFVRVANGSVWLNGLRVSAAPSLGERADTRGIAVVSLVRKPDGKLTAVGVRYVEPGGFGLQTAKAVRGGASQMLPQIRHANSPESVPPTDESDPVSAGSPAPGLPNPSNAPGSDIMDGSTPPMSPWSAGAASLPANGTSVAPETGTGAARIENVSPRQAPSTSDLISGMMPDEDASLIPAAASGSSSSVRATRAVLVGGSSSASAASLARSVSAASETEPVSIPRVVAAKPWTDLLATDLGRSWVRLGGIQSRPAESGHLD